MKNLGQNPSGFWPFLKNEPGCARLFFNGPNWLPEGAEDPLKESSALSGNEFCLLGKNSLPEGADPQVLRPRSQDLVGS